MADETKVTAEESKALDALAKGVGAPISGAGASGEAAPIEVSELEPMPDGFEVSGAEPGKEYRWLNRAEANVKRKMLLQGWKIVDGASPVDAGIRQADGTRVSGDTVLAERPIKVGDLHRARRAERQRRLEATPAEVFDARAVELNKEMRDEGFTGRGISTFRTEEDGSVAPRTGVKPHRRNWRMGATFDKEGQIVR